MKFVKLLLSLCTTFALVFALNKKWGAIPPIGKLISPQVGFWKNAESNDDLSNKNFSFKNLKGKVNVYMDKRLVPHIFAQNDEDAYFVQGFLHAKYRLWQMEFQTYFAAGRISEIVGEKALPSDRKFRRLGMVYAAQNALAEMQKDPLTKMAVEKYSDGVNAYINSLQPKDYALEYKLLDYKPEAWTPLKSMLLLKYMSYDLAGYEEDFEKENIKATLTKAMYETAFEYGNDSLNPILPNNTSFNVPQLKLNIPQNVETDYFNFGKNITNTITDTTKPNKMNGSNNWAVSGTKTKSGKPILSNDPHLGLNLPSLWYEIQINTPTHNSYGASLPGAPAVIIGFNDSCSFGFTNAMRDVRDYYEVKFKDNSKKEYLFNGKWKASTIHYDTIKLRGKPDYIDTVAYVQEWGPVMYDASYTGTSLTDAKANRTNGKNYAVRWAAHDPSNELKTFLLLNRSKNYNDYDKAISTFSCPGQNMIFACNNGDIAIKQQGSFPAKWYRQGDFPMPGWDSTYAWQGMIPQSDNYMMHNPERGFISSANQYPYNTKSYPYYLGGNYMTTRGYHINELLTPKQGITINDMQDLQNNNDNVFARMMLPVLLKHCNEASLTPNAKKYFNLIKSWNFVADTKSVGQTIFVKWNDALEKNIWSDELAKSKTFVNPQETTLLDALHKDTAMVFIDNINTPQKESLTQQVSNALNTIALDLEKAEKDNTIEWSKNKQTLIKHLMDVDKKMPISRYNLNIGGGTHIINATQKDHGPSWKMIVEMKDKVEAYGIYPGGQSGNPGSAYYDNSINDWAAGKYYKLWLMQQNEKESKDILFSYTFTN